MKFTEGLKLHFTADEIRARATAYAKLVMSAMRTSVTLHGAHEGPLRSEMYDNVISGMTLYKRLQLIIERLPDGDYFLTPDDIVMLGFGIPTAKEVCDFAAENKASFKPHVVQYDYSLEPPKELLANAAALVGDITQEQAVALGRTFDNLGNFFKKTLSDT